MLNPAIVRDHLDEVEKGLTERGATNLKADLAAIKELDTRRKAIIPNLEEARRERKELGARVALAKRAGESVDDLLRKGRVLSDGIHEQEKDLAAVEQEQQKLLLRLPNLPHKSVPRGADEKANQEINRWGEVTRFDFTPKAHWDLGPELGFLDFERAAQMSGARFAVLLGVGAKLNRAIINFMLAVTRRSMVILR